MSLTAAKLLLSEAEREMVIVPDTVVPSVGAAKEIFGGVVPTEYIPAVEAGFRLACAKGAKYRFPCVDIQATLFDGKSHDVDSSQDAFKLAAIECFRDAQLKAGLVLLEPIMNVVVHAPGKYLGDLTRDISRRRGEILNSMLEKGRCQMHAYVPLANSQRLIFSESVTAIEVEQVYAATRELLTAGRTSSLFAS